MKWDQNHGTYNYYGVSLGTKPAIGHKARLNKDNFHFDVEITKVEAGNCSGKIINMSPKPGLEKLGLIKGDTVSFKGKHIQRLFDDT